MAKLPGLTRQDDRPSVAGANRGRVQVRNPIGDVALQPQARPVDTYARPQQPNSGPSGLMQLAGALAQISPSVQNFLQVREDAARKEAEDRANRRIGGMSFEEARSAVASGQMTELEDPWFKAAFMKQYGERLAYQRVNELTAEYETNFDKNGGSFENFVRQRMSDDLEQYGNDPHFTGAYNQIMNNYGAKASQAQAQYRTEQVKLDTIGGVYDVFNGQARAMLSNGKSPEEIVAALRAGYDGNRQLLHLDYREQDKEMVRLAEAFANEGNVAMVEAILKSERTGSDGTALGPLSANREFQQDALRILTVAQRQLQSNNGDAALDARMRFNEQARTGQLAQDDLMAYHAANPGAFTDTQVISLINQNTSYQQQVATEAAKNEQKLALQAQARASEADLLARNMDLAGSGKLPYIREGTVLTASGETKTVSVEDQRKAVAAEIIQQNEWFKKNGGDPEVAFARNVEAFTVNDLVNPQWKQVLSAGPMASTPFTNSGGDLPDTLKNSTELYMRLWVANPKLLDRHITNASNRDFFENYRMATQYARLPLAQALQTATALTAAMEEPPSNAIRQQFDQIDEKVREIEWGGTWWIPFSGSTPENYGYVATELSRLGRFYARSGLDPDDALAEAKVRFEAVHTPVNGSFVYTAGRDVPQNFGELATRAIEKYVEDFGDAEGGLEASNLTIRPATNGNGWIIVNKLNGFLPVENSARANVTLRSLFDLDQERKLGLKQGIVDQQTSVQDKRLVRELGIAERWLGSPDAYESFSQIYGPAEADKRKAELEELLRANGRMN